jgi:hypothetical protein
MALSMSSAVLNNGIFPFVRPPLRSPFQQQPRQNDLRRACSGVGAKIALHDLEFGRSHRGI